LPNVKKSGRIAQFKITESIPERGFY